MEIVSYILMFGIIVIFIINKLALSSFHPIAEKILQTELGLPMDYYDDFHHYFLANAGIFVGRIRFPFGVAIFSSLHSFSMLLLIIINIINLIWGSMVVVFITIAIFLMLFMSSVARSYPNLNSRQKDMVRSAFNFLKENPDYEFSRFASGFPSFDAMIESYYDSALKITEHYNNTYGN